MPWNRFHAVTFLRTQQDSTGYGIRGTVQDQLREQELVIYMTDLTVSNELLAKSIVSRTNQKYSHYGNSQTYNAYKKILDNIWNITLFETDFHDTHSWTMGKIQWAVRYWLIKGNGTRALRVLLNEPTPPL